MNKKIHSLALLVNLGIYGVALPAWQTTTPPLRSTKTRW
jgi:hypothetical protein